MDGYSGSLQTNKRPPGSKERKGGLNPRPLGTRSEANVDNVALNRVLSNPIQTLVSQGYGLGFASGKWAPGPWAGQWEISFCEGRLGDPWWASLLETIGELSISKKRISHMTLIL